MMMNTRQRSSPFTASQWQELEHQALIFKYMMSGMPIPPDLLYPIRTGLDAISIATPTPPRLFPTHPIGWGCFQMGFGRKPDPEPGRCRRTDGKKWRCSKEAFPDSKYCEKHMHRGRNRSRKPVEVTTATAAAKTSDPPSAIPPPNPAKSTAISSFSSSIPNETHHPFLYNHPLSSRPPPSISLSPQNNNSLFNLGTGSYSSADGDYRYLHGLKDGVDEHAFFSEASGSLRGVAESQFDSSWRFTPLKTSSLSQLNQRNCSAFPSSYSQMQNQSNLTDMSKQRLETHCFVLGTDINSNRPVKEEREEEPQQPIRRFFDEWPQRGRDSWLDMEEDRSFSTTQLSISLPMASSEFPVANSRSLKGD